MAAESARACGVWGLEDLERGSTVRFQASSVHERPHGGASTSPIGIADDLPAELLAWERSDAEGPVPAPLRWDWRVDRGDTLSMDGTRMLRDDEVVGEWAGARQLRLGDEIYTFGLTVDPNPPPVGGSWFDLVVARDGETILAGRATSLCLSAIGIDDQQREIRTRAAYWLAHTRGAERIVPRIERIVATRDDAPRLPSPPARITAITASSTLGPEYGTERLSDGDPTTAWCEGTAFLGIGATLALAWTEPADPVLTVLPGYHRDEARLRGNGAPRRLLATTDTGVVREITLPFPEASSTAAHAIPLHAPGSRRVVLELVEAWPGERWSDTCISEIAIVPGA